MKKPGVSFFCLAARIGLAAVLAGCQPAVVPAARPTPKVFTVEVTPALQSMAGIFSTCTASLPNTGLVLLETPAQSLDLDRAPLALRWGPANAPDGFAALLGLDELVIIAHPDNPTSAISLEALRTVYTAAQVTQQGGAPEPELHAWAYPAGDDIQAVFETAVLGTAASPQKTATAPNPTAMREAVAGDPAAIGFLPRRWLNQTVKALPVTHLNPDVLRQPILAYSKTEPADPQKGWLLCVQQRLTE